MFWQLLAARLLSVERRTAQFQHRGGTKCPGAMKFQAFEGVSSSVAARAKGELPCFFCCYASLHSFRSSKLAQCCPLVFTTWQAEIGSPLPGRPDEGRLEIAVDCSPTAAPEFQVGRGCTPHLGRSCQGFLWRATVLRDASHVVKVLLVPDMCLGCAWVCCTHALGVAQTFIHRRCSAPVIHSGGSLWRVPVVRDRAGEGRSCRRSWHQPYTAASWAEQPGTRTG